MISLLSLPTEAIMDVAAWWSYYQYLPRKLSLPFKANINADAIACHIPPWKISSMPQPTSLSLIPSPAEASINTMPTKVSVNVAVLRSYLQCHHLPELSLVPPPTETTIGADNDWSIDPMLIQKSYVSRDDRDSYSNREYQHQTMEDNELMTNQILALLLLPLSPPSSFF